MPDRETEAVPPTDGNGATRRNASAEPPVAVGNYHILRKLDEGGMGEVYEAEQHTPVRRKVALKLIKWGMDTRKVVVRFESERQALALMNHPNIARVFDAGATEQGRPYFAMEFVRGIPIDEYCDKHRLNTRQRLELFLQVCEGLQHAHQKGIIHRDIKPSNVLVEIQDDKPAPKIIDFGIAKATAQRLTERTSFTELGQLVGTPEFMSPEQAEMSALDIDTRTDVYSLGVLLYRLLIGALPFDSRRLRRSSLDEIRRTIREEEPLRPSTRLGSLGEGAKVAAWNRRTELSTLSRQLRGDLDWITMKALEKDRTRRYPSASELALDIVRHLRNEPVLASPPSTLYRIGKFVRRHRVTVAAGSLVLVALLTGMTLATLGLWRAVKAEETARREAETARQVSDFLVGLFGVSDPSEAKGNSITAREILDEGAARIQQELQDQPRVQARLMTTMGEVYRSLGLYAQARPLLEQALATRRENRGDRDPEIAESLNQLAILLWTISDYETARPLAERALEIREESLGPDHPDVAASLNTLANVRWDSGDHEGARPLYERALAIKEKALGPNDLSVAAGLNNLGGLLLRTGDYDEARVLYERALAIREEALGPDHLDVARSLGNLAAYRTITGDYAGARPLYERALAIREKVLGPDHPELATSLNQLGGLLSRTGEYVAARPFYERALEIRQNALGPDHPAVALSLNNLGFLLKKIGDYEAARPLFERAIAIQQQALGPDHPDLALSLNNLGDLLRDIGDYSGSRALLERALELRQATLNADHPHVAFTLNSLARLHEAAGDYEPAEELYTRALKIRESKFGPEHPSVAESLEGYADLLRRTGRFEEAAVHEARATRIRAKTGTAR